MESIQKHGQANVAMILVGNKCDMKDERKVYEAEAKGLGAINVDGIMVDVASIRILRNTILNKADLFGM